MDTSQHQPLSRAVRLTVIGAVFAFLWLALCLVLGFGADHAHADDSEDSGGALSTLTHAVTGTVGSVTDGLTDVAGAVVGTATETTIAVVPPAAPVVIAVTETAAVVVAPVHEVVSSEVVSSVITPVVQIVTEVPVVGEVVAELGVDDVLTDVATTVDDAAQDLTGGLVAALPAVNVPEVDLPVIHTNNPLTEATAPRPAEEADAAASVSATDTVAFLFTTAARTAEIHRFFPNKPAAIGLATASAAFVADRSSTPTSTPVGLCGPPGFAALGSGGSGPGASALLALGPLVAHRAWVQRHGSENDEAPPAPATSTDVSPD